MFSKNPSLVLSLGFIAGCGAAAIAPLVIPPAHAQTTQRWEAHCIGQDEGGYRAAISGYSRIASEAGREGWELVGFAMTGSGASGHYDGIVCFKRPAP